MLERRGFIRRVHVDLSNTNQSERGVLFQMLIGRVPFGRTFFEEVFTLLQFVEQFRALRLRCLAR